MSEDLMTNSKELVYYGSDSNNPLLIRAWQMSALKQIAKKESLETFFLKLAHNEIFGRDKRLIFVELKNPVKAIKDFRQMFQGTGYDIVLENGEDILDNEPVLYEEPPPVEEWEQKILGFIAQKLPLERFFAETLSLVCNEHRKLLVVNPKDPVEAVSRLNQQVLAGTNYYVRLTTDRGRGFLRAV